MKLRINILIGLALLCLAGCVKDDSIVVSKKLDDIKVSGINPTYSAAIDDILSINPVIDKQFTNEADLQYVWYAYTKASQFAADTLSRVKNLAEPITLSPETYTLVLKITDKTTGVFYKSYTELTVVNDYTPGLIILSENEGQASLQFLNTISNKFIDNVYGKANDGESLGQNPVSVSFYIKVGQMPSEVLVLCKDQRGGIIADPITFKKNRDIRKSFVVGWSDAGIINSQKHVEKAPSGLQDHLIIAGKIYNRATNSGETLFKPELIGGDYVASSVYFYEGSSRPTFFDTKNLKFVCQDGTGGLLNTFPSGPTANIIDPNNVGLSPLYGGNITGNNYFGVFETPDKTKRYILRFLSNSQARSFTAAEKYEMSAHDAMNAQNFASSKSLQNYLFYSVGGKVYVFNVLTKNGGLLFDLGNSSINLLKMTGLELKVGYINNTLTGKKGSFATYDITTVGGVTATQTRQKQGFCDKVIDITNKN